MYGNRNRSRIYMKDKLKQKVEEKEVLEGQKQSRERDWLRKTTNGVGRVTPPPRPLSKKTLFSINPAFLPKNLRKKKKMSKSVSGKKN